MSDQNEVSSPPAKAEPGDRDSVTIEGTVERFIFQSVDRDFAIALVAATDGLERWVTKGSLWGISVGECVALTGRYVEDPRYGRQFAIEAARPVLPSSAVGIERYLSSTGIKGIGLKLAERIVAAFGDQALKVICEHPERLGEVHGLGPARRTALLEVLVPRLNRDAALIYLLDLAIGPAMASRILKTYGQDAVRIVRLDPYRLAGDVVGIGFRVADRIASAQGVTADDPKRIEAGILFALDQLAQRGHTAPQHSRVLTTAVEVLGGSRPDVAAACQRLVAKTTIEQVDTGPSHVAKPEDRLRLALPRLSRAEASLSSDLLRLAGNQGSALSETELDKRLALAGAALGFELAGSQRDAVIGAMTSGLMVVTGGPGTGKTTIVQGVIAASEPDGVRVALAAPTGRAARRLAEATLCDAKTVHRLLEFEPRTRTFQRDAQRPLDADLVIIDESSMLDARLAAALCRAVAAGARLLLVGDSDQLPSVGPGAVLDDLIASDRCPVVHLDRIYRQADRSLIVENAHRMRRGQVPISAAAGQDGDFFVVARNTPEEIIETVLEIVCRRLPRRFGFDPIDDIQLLVPMHRGALGTEAFNRLLGQALNPDGEPLGRGLRVGDKVIQVRNNYDLDIFNGDIGRTVSRNGEQVLVRFGKREIVYDNTALEDLQLAYAITVHKSQGSEYPAVVAPLHMQHRMLLQRNLLYTAVTRARRFAVLVGEHRAVQMAVRNDEPMTRATLLRWYLNPDGQRQARERVGDRAES
jgi:exodeoxyribonuclease V alpha subunit